MAIAGSVTAAMLLTILTIIIVTIIVRRKHMHLCASCTKPQKSTNVLEDENHSPEVKKKRLFLKIKFMIWFVCTVCTDVIECFVEEEGKLHTYLLTCTFTYLLTYLLPVKPLVYRAVRRLASREKEPLLKTRQRNLK